jgi:fumarate reductase flavoprotein subunit
MKKKKMHRFFFGFAVLLIAAIFSLSGCPTDSDSSGGAVTYKDGTYTADADGRNGPVELEVIIKDGKIDSVRILSHTESIDEPDIGPLVHKALDEIPSAIVTAQSTNVDKVSGATLTSNAIKNAVKAALDKAAGKDKSSTIVLPFQNTDVIVVGAGLAGLTASVKSAELGANVLVFEQTGVVGGAGNSAGGTILGVNTIMQKDDGITDDTTALLIQDFNKLGGTGNFDMALATAYGDKSGAVVDWLDQTLNVVFADNRKPGEGAYDKLNRRRAHIIAPADGDTSYAAGMARGGSGLVKTLKEKLDEYVADKKAYLAMNVTVTDLILEKGKVVGVTARNKDGSFANYKAPSIILATGGYGHNLEMLKQYNFLSGNVSTQAVAGSNGSGYALAKAAGAEFQGMDYCSSYAGNIRISGFSSITLAADTGGQTGAMKWQIWVDKNGKRMENEPKAHTHEKSGVWNSAADNIVYIILDAKFKTTHAAVSPLSRQLPDAGWARLDELAAGGEYAFKGDTIGALADAAGINKTELIATVEKYNKVVNGEITDEFGRRNDPADPLNGFLEAFDQGPYYAIKTTPFIMMTSGGVKANAQAQMCKADGTPIPGAYLAGEIIGLGNVAGKNTIAGMGNGDAAVWGFIAAENAVKNASK